MTPGLRDLPMTLKLPHSGLACGFMGHLVWSCSFLCGHPQSQGMSLRSSFHQGIHGDVGCACRSSIRQELFSLDISNHIFAYKKGSYYGFGLERLFNLFLNKKFLFMILVGFITARSNNWGSRERRNAVSWRIWIF